jgi:diguanylate cyclase
VTSNIEQPDQWASKALAFLQERKLLPLPDNYTVAYHYVAKTNPNLCMAIDMLLGHLGQLTQTHMTELYNAHLGLEAEYRVFREANSNIESELKRVISAIDQSKESNSQYDQTLTSFRGNLEQDHPIADLRQAVSRVIEETRVIATQNQKLQSQLAQSTQQMTEIKYTLDIARKESLIDPLTEVGNRKFFNIELQRATQDAVEKNNALSLLMIDIDYFKKFNDNYGHLIGDQVLRLVARTLIENLKGRDIIARYGGEEFVIMLPQTYAVDAVRVGNHLRAALGSKQIKRKNSTETLGQITISIGVTEYFPGEPLNGFIDRADAALYEAKRAGRNRVVCRIQNVEEGEPLATQQKVLDSPSA